MEDKSFKFQPKRRVEIKEGSRSKVKSIDVYYRSRPKRCSSSGLFGHRSARCRPGFQEEAVLNAYLDKEVPSCLQHQPQHQPQLKSEGSNNQKTDDRRMEAENQTTVANEEVVLAAHQQLVLSSQVDPLEQPDYPIEDLEQTDLHAQLDLADDTRAGKSIEVPSIPVADTSLQGWLTGY